MAEKYEIAIIYYKEIYDKIKKINIYSRYHSHAQIVMDVWMEYGDFTIIHLSMIQSKGFDAQHVTSVSQR